MKLAKARMWVRPEVRAGPEKEEWAAAGGCGAAPAFGTPLLLQASREGHKFA